jgi:hypothetical protein
MKCTFCNQSILDGEMFERVQGTRDDHWFQHALPTDCVAATARRCKDIVRANYCIGDSPYFETTRQIEAEFIAPKQESPRA